MSLLELFFIHRQQAGSLVPFIRLRKIIHRKHQPAENDKCRVALLMHEY